MTENLMIYLDTSIVERYFKRAIDAKRQKKQIKLPEIFQHFKNHSEIKLHTSIFTLAEIFEHLWKSYKISSSEIAKITQQFIIGFNIKVIFEFHIKAEILRWIRKYSIEAKDVLHLSIVRESKLCLLTADYNLLERGKIIYEFIKSDKEMLSNKFSG